MTIALDQADTGSHLEVRSITGWVAAAGLTSLGAGAIHAAAIGIHSEHRQAVLTFSLVAVVQLAWGGLALVRSSRLVALLGALIGTSALVGWAVAKTSGIGFIDGLDEAEPIQTADGLAAGLALGSVLLLAWSFRGARSERGSAESGSTGFCPPLGLTAVGITGLTVFGMVAAGTHAHAGTGVGATAAGGHHGDGAVATEAAGDDDDNHGDMAMASSDDGEEHAAVETVPYDPDMPIDLGGVEGVTPQQQAQAENIVAETLQRLPQWSDPAVAEAAGFRSIGDGFTGIEHFVNPAFMENPNMLDPDEPESLVYNTEGGGRRLVAAMYMVQRGTPLEDVPEIGGDLMQWHTHQNLCYNADGKIAGITDDAGNCPAGLVKPVPTPMIHVWIEPHPCGPFAALEGIGGGTIAAGEERLCDTAHGAH